MNSKSFFLSLVTALGFLGAAHAQMYFVSTPVNGYVQLAVEDAAGSASACGSGNAGFGILNDTVYLDLNAGTIREVGSVSLGGSGSFTFDDNRIVNGSNGLQFVAANVTLSLSVPNALSFDTGVQPLLWISAIQGYEFTASLGSVPVSGTYSVVTGGTTYTGLLNYNLYTGMLLLFQQVSTSGYPAFVTLAGFNGGELQHAGPQLVYFTALDGLNIELHAGEQDGTYSYEWSLNPFDIEADLVPEPGTVALVALGACTLAPLYRRRRRRHRES